MTLSGTCSAPPADHQPLLPRCPRAVRRPLFTMASSSGTDTKEVPPARAALLQAVASGRLAPPAPLVRALPAGAAVGRPSGQSVFAGLHVEELQLCNEGGAGDSIIADNRAISSKDDTSSSWPPQGWVPLRLVKQHQRQTAVGADPEQPRLPVVLLLHATGVDKDSLAVQQAAFARRGYLAVSLDCRYHGERAEVGAASRDGYQQALVRAWRGSGERPFLLDNVWDILRTLDYLQQRPDVDAVRIGLTGISLGGMHTWLAAAADKRVAVAAPMIGVQYFGWAVQQRQYQARVDSIPLVFQAAAADLALSQQAAAAARQQCGSGSCPAEITPEVVAAVWDVLLPGMLQHYDAPQSLPLVAPRPLLIANGELDPRCPMQGVELALEAARAEYARQGAADALQLFVDPGVGHECTDSMWAQVFAFMDRHLLQQQDS